MVRDFPHFCQPDMGIDELVKMKTTQFRSIKRYNKNGRLMGKYHRIEAIVNEDGERKAILNFRVTNAGSGYVTNALFVYFSEYCHSYWQTVLGRPYEWECILFQPLEMRLEWVESKITIEINECKPARFGADHSLFLVEPIIEVKDRP